MKYLLFFLFPFYAFSYSDLYDWTEKKFKEVFEVEYYEDIELEGIHLLDNWDCVHEIVRQRVKRNYGIFNNMYQRDRNEIFILDNGSSVYPLDSRIVHELAHFFSKKAGFNEEFNGIDIIYDTGLIEGIAYYIQELYLNEKGQSIFDFLELKEGDKEMFILFEYESSVLYKREPGKYFFNVVEFFKTGAAEKFRTIMTRYSRIVGPKLRDPKKIAEITRQYDMAFSKCKQ